MAKKTTRGFNMAAEIRAILETEPTATGREALSRLKEKFPKQDINENSFGMAYSTARKKLGLAPLRKSKKKVARKAAANRQSQASQTARSSASAQKLSIESLQSAARFLAEVGSADAAVAAIKQVQALQIR